jgi:hypothetical protein
LFDKKPDLFFIQRQNQIDHAGVFGVGGMAERAKHNPVLIRRKPDAGTAHGNGVRHGPALRYF